MSMKIPLTPGGNEPATFRFVAQHLNHCATAVPFLLVKSKSNGFGGCSPQVFGYQDIQNVGCRIKGILLRKVVFEGDLQIK